MSMTMRQVYDAVVGDTTILANRSSYVDFTLPYATSGVGMVVPLKDSVTRSSLIFFTPLTWGLWVTTLGSFFVLGFVVWILEHRVNTDFTGPWLYQISTMFWFAFSIMVFAPSMCSLLTNQSTKRLLFFFLKFAFVL